jgi:multiple sugar transport system permease protein
VIAVGGTLLVLAVALPAAYYAARHRFPGRLVFLLLVLVTQMLQPTVLAAGLFRQFQGMGIHDTWLAMILVNGAFNLSFAVWIMHSFFAGVPREVEDEGDHELDVSVNVPSDVRVRDVVPETVTVEVETMTSQDEQFRVSDAGSSP